MQNHHHHEQPKHDHHHRRQLNPKLNSNLVIPALRWQLPPQINFSPPSLSPPPSSSLLPSSSSLSLSPTPSQSFGSLWTVGFSLHQSFIICMKNLHCGGKIVNLMANIESLSVEKICKNMKFCYKQMFLSQFLQISNIYLAERPCVAHFLRIAADSSFILFWQSNLPASEDLLETSQGWWKG